jgi:hypothetical protein
MLPIRERKKEEKKEDFGQAFFLLWTEIALFYAREIAKREGESDEGKEMVRSKVDEQLGELSRSHWRSLSRLLLLILTGRSIRKEISGAIPYLERDFLRVSQGEKDDKEGEEGRKREEEESRKLNEGETHLLQFCVRKVCELFADQLALDLFNSQKILISLEKRKEDEEKEKMIDLKENGGEVDKREEGKGEDEKMKQMIGAIESSYSSYVEIRLNMIEQVCPPLLSFFYSFPLSE